MTAAFALTRNASANETLADQHVQADVELHEQDALRNGSLHRRASGIGNHVSKSSSRSGGPSDDRASEQSQDTSIGSYDPAEVKRVIRKLDKWLMPLFGVIYMLQYVDKSAMSYAAVYSFREDRSLSSRQYSWLGSIFYLGYLGTELPGSFLLQKLRTNYYMGTLAVLWGALVMLMAAPKGFRGLAAVRALLGGAEAMVTPGFALLTARFYTRQEQPLRFALWYSCNGLGSCIGGLLGYGVGHIDIYAVYNWAWIFILNGALTIIAGIAFLIVCPNSPAQARFLTPKEREIAIDRVRVNQSSLQDKHIKLYQLKEALNPFVDPQGWLLFLAVLSLTIPNGGLGNFFHLILQEYGYSTFQTILLGLPTGVVQAIVVVGGGYFARRWQNKRLIIGIFGVTWSLLGVTIQYSTRNNPARLFGYYIIVGFVGALSQLFALPAANITGYTKRVTVQAMVFVAYAGGNAIGPQFWTSGQNPPYRDGMLTCIICFSSSIGLLMLLRLYYLRENRRRDLYEQEHGKYEYQDFADITDLENKSYRYVM